MMFFFNLMDFLCSFFVILLFIVIIFLFVLKVLALIYIMFPNTQKPIDNFTDKLLDFSKKLRDKNE